MAVHAAAPRLTDVLRHGVGGHGDNGNGRQRLIGQGAYGPGRVVAVHDGHLDVHEHGVVVSGPGARHPVHGLLAVDDRIDLEAGVVKYHLGYFAVDGVVFGQQDAHALEVHVAVDAVAGRGAGLLGRPAVGKGDAQREARSLARRALDGDGAAHELGDVPGDGQAESRALLAALGGAALPLEGLEDPGRKLGSHAKARVPDRELVLARALPDPVWARRTDTQPAWVNLQALPTRLRTMRRKWLSSHLTKGSPVPCSPPPGARPWPRAGLRRGRRSPPPRRADPCPRASARCGRSRGDSSRGCR